MTTKTKYNYLVKALSFFRVPLLFSTSPRVVEFSDKVTTAYLPLSRKNKNHVGSMYFGALSMGAELSIALMAIKGTNESKHKVTFIFKDFSAQFLKRADKGVYFTCEEADVAMEIIRETEKSGERVEKTMKGYAYTDQKTKEPILTYTLTLSVKRY